MFACDICTFLVVPLQPLAPPWLQVCTLQHTKCCLNRDNPEGSAVMLISCNLHESNNSVFHYKFLQEWKKSVMWWNHYHHKHHTSPTSSSSKYDTQFQEILTLPKWKEDYRFHSAELQHWFKWHQKIFCSKVEKEQTIECKSDRNIIDDGNIQISSVGAERKKTQLHCNSCLLLLKMTKQYSEKNSVAITTSIYFWQLYTCTIYFCGKGNHKILCTMEHRGNLLLN